MGVKCPASSPASARAPQGHSSLGADAAGAKRARVLADLLQGTDERPDVGLGEVIREVSCNPVPVVPAREFLRLVALLGEHDEDRAAVVLGANAADELRSLHPVDDAREAALAVKDPVGERVHRYALRGLLELDKDVVPAQRDSGLLLEFGVEHVEES